MDFKDEWDLDTAMKILQNQTVDSKLWAEAVEWLLLYGPPEVVSLLLQASTQATENAFPDLQPVDYTPEGERAYNVAEIAKALDISEEEAERVIAQKELAHRKKYFFPGSSDTIH